MMETDKQTELILRLKKIEGQARGLCRMIEEGRTCEDVVTQLAAVRSALDQVGLLFISCQMQECMNKGESEGRSREESLEKLMKLFLKLA